MTIIEIDLTMLSTHIVGMPMILAIFWGLIKKERAVITATPIIK